MLTLLDIPYADTAAAHLAWSWGLAPLPALATRTVHLGEIALELRVLGSSHQVLAQGPAGHWSETVACLPGDGAALPEHASITLDGWHYTFSAQRQVLGEADFRAVASEAVERAERSAGGLVGVFPGESYAVTAVVAERVRGRREGVSWQTWHSYPRTAEILTTRARVVPR